MPATQPVKMFPPRPRELLKSTSTLPLPFEDTSRSSDLLSKVTFDHRFAGRVPPPIGFQVINRFQPTPQVSR